MAIRHEILATWIALTVTGIASILFFVQQFELAEVELFLHHPQIVAEIGLYLLLVGFLVYGNFGYQLARLGYLKRLVRHRPAPLTELRKYALSAPALTILVPSYREEPHVIRQTLLSAALQQYPNKHVVLLLDDPPQPRRVNDRETLHAARRLTVELQHLLDEPAHYFAQAYLEFQERQHQSALNALDECIRLAKLYEKAAEFFMRLESECCLTTHTDVWFAERILKDPRRALYQRADELRQLKNNVEGTCDVHELHLGYCHLSSLFEVKLTVFERKRYRNLSHEPNKAMNLNGYLGLMGKHFIEVERPDGLYLEEHDIRTSTLSIPNSPYVITLDADSLLLPDYALRLIYHIERPGNERIAVVQTPYSAIPNAPSAMERTAGATTDIQYLIHQGFTYFSATFWVGANALLRKAALDDIVVMKQNGAGQVPCYIQDGTVIEDTESTVDLITRRWQLFNYPARLAYSATPDDFGSLLIQRGRWANGGLLIVPKLLRYLRAAPKNGRICQEAFYRFHYLTSLAGAPLSVLLLMLVPFSSSLASVWLPLTALPYFVLYGRDLSLMGYHGWRDLYRVYALNLLLIPIHLSGAFKSLKQKLTGRKTPFQRTPKVYGRTRAPRLYIAFEYALALLLIALAMLDGVRGRWFASSFAILNGGLLLYAIHRFIGFRESLDDFTFRGQAAVTLSSTVHPRRLGRQ
ncbi:MAG: glycosyltransferase family 2 protein [Nitrospiraceae bacterium]